MRSFSTLPQTNLYNNCECSSSFTKSWAVNSEIAPNGNVSEVASGYWIGGTSTAIACSFLSTIFFVMTKGDDLFKMDAQ